MDSFRLIQNFFTRMSCQYCQNHFAADDIELIREDHGIHVVSVYCHHCQRQVGVAMVGVDAHGAAALEDADSDVIRKYADPELTEAELERLSQFEPISDDDVLAAHHFFSSLGDDWMKHLPPVNPPAEASAVPTPETAPQTEVPEL